MIDPENEDETSFDEPDNPDEWRDCAEDRETCLDEMLDAEGIPRV